VIHSFFLELNFLRCSSCRSVILPSAEELGQGQPAAELQRINDFPQLPFAFHCLLKPLPRHPPCIDTNKQDACYSEPAPASDQDPTSQPTGSQEWRVSASFSRTAFNGRLESHAWQFSEHLFIQTNADHLLLQLHGWLGKFGYAVSLSQRLNSAPSFLSPLFPSPPPMRRANWDSFSD
jgi:hypothetical protein